MRLLSYASGNETARSCRDAAIERVTTELHTAVDTSLDEFFSDARRQEREAMKHCVVDSHLYEDSMRDRLHGSLVESWLARSVGCSDAVRALTAQAAAVPTLSVEIGYALTQQRFRMNAGVTCAVKFPDGRTPDVTSTFRWAGDEWRLGKGVHSRLINCLEELLSPNSPVEKSGEDEYSEARYTLGKVARITCGIARFSQLDAEYNEPGHAPRAFFELDARVLTKSEDSDVIESDRFPLLEGMSPKAIDMKCRGYAMEGIGSWIKTPEIRLQLQSPTWDEGAYSSDNVRVLTEDDYPISESEAKTEEHA